MIGFPGVSGTYGDTNVSHSGEASSLLAGHVGGDVLGCQTGSIFLRLLQTMQLNQVSSRSQTDIAYTRPRTKYSRILRRSVAGAGLAECAPGVERRSSDLKITEPGGGSRRIRDQTAIKPSDRAENPHIAKLSATKMIVVLESSGAKSLETFFCQGKRQTGHSISTARASATARPRERERLNMSCSCNKKDEKVSFVVIIVPLIHIHLSLEIKRVSILRCINQHFYVKAQRRQVSLHD